MTVIAIDGPAGSGKSTIAQALADQLRSEVLDTGAMYRAVTFAVLTAGVDPADADAAAAVACRADVVVDGRSVTVDGVDATTAIRGPEVSAAVSIVSAYPPVRAHLREMQRRWMVEHGGGVVEGRDIGTVVFPDAALKVFLIADASVRARRRAGDGQLDETTAAANIEARDRLDSTRADSPLVAAEDAVVLDTSDLTVDEVVARIVAHLAEATR